MLLNIKKGHDDAHRCDKRRQLSRKSAYDIGHSTCQHVCKPQLATVHECKLIVMQYTQPFGQLVCLGIVCSCAI